jgi:hypothetical protein
LSLHSLAPYRPASSLDRKKSALDLSEEGQPVLLEGAAFLVGNRSGVEARDHPVLAGPRPPFDRCEAEEVPRCGPLPDGRRPAAARERLGDGAIDGAADEGSGRRQPVPGAYDEIQALHSAPVRKAGPGVVIRPPSPIRHNASTTQDVDRDSADVRTAR